MLYSEFVTGTGIENRDLYDCIDKAYMDDNEMTKEDAYCIAKEIEIRPSTTTLDMYFQIKLEYEKVKIVKEILKKEEEIKELKNKYEYVEKIIDREVFGITED